MSATCEPHRAQYQGRRQPALPPHRQAELSYGYRFGLMDGVFQRGNKIQLDGVTVQNHKLELKGSDFVVRAYTLIENTGNSYNLNPWP